MLASATKGPGNSLKMNKVQLTLVVVCVLFHQYISAQEEECKADGEKIKAAIKETIENGEVPCNDEYDLGRFQWTDKSEVQAKEEEFKAWMSEKSDEEKKAVMECLIEIFQKGIEKVEGEISGECLEKLKKKT